MLNEQLFPGLRACALFSGIPDIELKSLLSCLNTRASTYSKNQVMTVTGTHLHGIGILTSGEAIITKENAAGDRSVVDVIGRGEVFGEIAAFSGEPVWPATVIAQEQSTAVFIEVWRITRTCDNACPGHRQLIDNALGIVAHKARILSRKLEYMSIKSLRAKVATFILEQAQKSGRSTFIMPLNRNELADFFSVSRPSLSREMGRMRDEGLIDYHRSAVVIKNHQALSLAVRS